MEVPTKLLRISRRKSTVKSQICAKDERNASFKKISAILQKPDNTRSTEDLELLLSYADIVLEVKKRLRKRSIVKQRLLEIEDPMEELVRKCKILASCIKEANHLIVYTGAGISTAARIPDYRGTNGIWTRLQQGKDIGTHDLSLADPTYTHMALANLYRHGILKYIVSQNCDGLHLRSGFPRDSLSELHGNMSIEVCKQCKPSRQYWRLFDVTEYTARYSHKTMRRCYHCNSALIDTIVHFGERGTLQWPLNWSGACSNADKADVIICLGTSLKVLKKYPWLWHMDKPIKKRPKLFIVNLQWTPKDDVATMKINGKCDAIMHLIMSELGMSVPDYDRNLDPIFAHATDVCEIELHTKTQPELKRSENHIKIETDSLENNEKNIKSETIKADVDIKIEDVKSQNISESKSPVKDSIFSIDNLLTSSTAIVNPIHSTILNTYYPFHLFNTNFLTPNMYPYQTSFLYSGLHSIINPMPFMSYDFQIQPKNNSFFSQSTTAIQEKQVPKCDFCFEQYKSYNCLFYVKTESKFQKPPVRFSRSQNKNREIYCECCDYSSDSAAEEDEQSDEKKVKMSEEGENNTMDILVNTSVKIQPGWFGKGYKKRKNRKR